MTRPLTLDIAWTIASRLAGARRVTLVRPDDPRRLAVVYALAAVHALTGSAWDVEHARQSVSVTLPEISTAPMSLIRLVPGALGETLRQVARTQDRTTVYLSPAACSDPALLLATVAHELGHADQIAAGGLAWCAAYGLVPEVRAGAEAPCYGQDVVVLYVLDDSAKSARSHCLDALDRLGAYDLRPEGFALAQGILGVVERTLEHGGTLGGPSADVIRELRAEGVL